MPERKNIDKKISEIVRSLDRPIPDGLDERLRIAALTRKPRFDRPERSRRLWPAVVFGTVVSAALLAVLLFGPGLQPKPGTEISEIRTQFELVDKNITIVFIQKPDFKLILEERP
jgi:hypothetical protein